MKHWARLFDWLLGLLALVVIAGTIYAVTVAPLLPR